MHGLGLAVCSLIQSSAAAEGLYDVDAMILFVLQDDIIGVVDACLERVYTSTGPSVRDQASDQP